MGIAGPNIHDPAQNPDAPRLALCGQTARLRAQPTYALLLVPDSVSGLVYDKYSVFQNTYARTTTRTPAQNKRMCMRSCTASFQRGGKILGRLRVGMPSRPGERCQCPLLYVERSSRCPEGGGQMLPLTGTRSTQLANGIGFGGGRTEVRAKHCGRDEGPSLVWKTVAGRLATPAGGRSNPLLNAWRL